MVMQRRHAKNPLARELERANLNDYRKRFENENAANEKQQNFLLDDYGDHADCASERERAYVAHEHFGRMRDGHPPPSTPAGGCSFKKKTPTPPPPRPKKKFPLRPAAGIFWISKYSAM